MSSTAIRGVLEFFTKPWKTAIDSAPWPTWVNDIAVKDCEMQLDAVLHMLRPATAPAKRKRNGGARGASVQTRVTQCVAALEQLRAHLVELKHQALHDALTSLPNDRHFRQTVDEVLARSGQEGQALAVFYVDLDGFKLVNDAHGHAVGDEVLRIVAARLASMLRAGDMVSRRGGDEFVCLLADLPGRDKLAKMASEMSAAISAPLTVNALVLSVYPSIGIAVFPTHGADADALLAGADAAMYRAKRLKSGLAFCEEATTSGQA